MTTLLPVLDLACGPIQPPRTLPTGGHAAANRCRRVASDALIATLAAPSAGLYRDEEGVWWTGDWEVRLAGPDDPGAWQVLTDLAHSLGFDE